MIADILPTLPLLSPAWLLSVLIAAALGYGAGIVYFASLRSVANRLADGDWTAVPLQIGRFALLGLVLFAAALVGAQALLAMAAGVLFGRRRVLAQEEKAT